MKIAVIGTGYVGLVTATCLAESGNDVIGIDKDSSKIARLDDGELPIYEPGLLELVQRNMREGRLRFTTDLASGIAPAQIIFIAVGTPQATDGAADLSNVWAVADAVAAALNGPKIIVTKSTMPVGSGDLVSSIISQHLAHAEITFSVVSNPEFLAQGTAVADCQRPDRIVLGSSNHEAASRVADLYLPLRAPIIFGAPIGHTVRPMLTIPFGVRARLRAAGEGHLEILEPAVSAQR